MRRKGRLNKKGGGSVTCTEAEKVTSLANKTIASGDSNLESTIWTEIRKLKGELTEVTADNHKALVRLKSNAKGWWTKQLHWSIK